MFSCPNIFFFGKNWVALGLPFVYGCDRRYLRDELEATIQRKKNEMLIMERVLCMYDWKATVEAFKIKIDNCWGNRKNVEAPHAFIYKRSEGEHK